MSVSEMTHVSYFFMIMAALFGVITVVMYFVLDIRRCWKIVWRNHISAVKEKTLFETPLMPEKTILLEKTMPLETITLVQDIVMMDDGNFVNP